MALYIFLKKHWKFFDFFGFFLTVLKKKSHFFLGKWFLKPNFILLLGRYVDLCPFLPGNLYNFQYKFLTFEDIYIFWIFVLIFAHFFQKSFKMVVFAWTKTPLRGGLGVTLLKNLLKKGAATGKPISSILALYIFLKKKMEIFLIFFWNFLTVLKKKFHFLGKMIFETKFHTSSSTLRRSLSFSY